MKFSLSSVLAASLMIAGCAASAPEMQDGPVGQAAMGIQEHTLPGDVPAVKNNGLGIQPRHLNVTENLWVHPDCLKLGNCKTETSTTTATKTHSALPEITVCKTCTRFTTVTKTATTTELTTTTKAADPCGKGKTPCPAACPDGKKECSRPCGKDEEACPGRDGMPKCCRKKEHGGHGGPPGGHGGHGGHGDHPPQHPGKYYEPLYDEDGIMVKRPKNTQARDGALDLWSEEQYTGHRAIYGRKLNTCDTLETLTHPHMGFGKSAHLRWRDTCCQLFSARGCNGDFMMLAGDLPSLAPYDFENKVKSVRCMSADKCHAFYHNEEWRHHG